MGLSAVTEHGFEKLNQAKDIADVLDTLHVASAGIVGHDIGNMVAFAFAERYPERTTKLVMMDAPVPGVGPWDDILKSLCCGISGLAESTWRGWSRAVSASISTLLE